MKTILVRGDVYVLCSSDGLHHVREYSGSGESIAGLNALLEKADELDIRGNP